MSPKNICPMLLAAGQSQRFGSDKLLHPVSHKSVLKPMILHTLQVWLEVFPELNIVVRQDNTALLEILQKCEFSSRIQLVTLPNAHKGMSYSLITGIQAHSQADAWLVGLADMPFIDKAVISQSVLALQANAPITQAEFEGRRGHPVGFSSQFLPRLLLLTGDKGGKPILETFADLITPVISPDDGICRDIDTKENLVN